MSELFKKLSHSELIIYAEKWLKRPYKNSSHMGHSACSLVLSELATFAGETPDAIGWGAGRTILIECKTSMSDFYADAKKPWRILPNRGMGNLRYFLSEKGILNIDKIPDKWGLLEIINGKVEVAKDAKYQESNKDNEVIMLLSHIRREKMNGR